MGRKRKREKQLAALFPVKERKIEQSEHSVNANNFLERQKWCDWYSDMCKRESENVKNKIGKQTPEFQERSAMQNLLKDGKWQSEQFKNDPSVPVETLKRAAEATLESVKADMVFTEPECHLLLKIEQSIAEIMTQGPSEWFAAYEKEQGVVLSHEIKYESTQYINELVQPVYDEFMGEEFCLKVGIRAVPFKPVFDCGCLFSKDTKTKKRIAISLFGACPKVLEHLFGGEWYRNATKFAKTSRASSGSSGPSRSVHCEDYDYSYTAYRNWMKGLNKRELATYLVSVKPSIAGPEHYQELGGKAQTAIEKVCGGRVRKLRRVVESYVHANQEKSGDNLSKWMGKLISNIYKKDASFQTKIMGRASKGGPPITYTVGMVKHALPGLEPLMELLHNKSPDSDESEVCGTVVAIYALGPRLFEEITASGWFDVPLDQWHRVFKDPLVQIRKTMSFGRIKGVEILKLRKLLNVTIRRTGDSDILMEHDHRARQVTRKSLHGYRAYEGKGVSTFTAYEQEYAKISWEVINKAVTAMPDDIQRRTVEEFWSERAMRGAPGASKAIKQTGRLYSVVFHELEDIDRPGKRDLIEKLPPHALREFLLEQPADRAYFFVKPEPGLKPRSLCASYDEELFISSYVNQSIENYMGRWPGIMVKRSPVDVANWMTASKARLAGPEGKGAYWVSSDYSDYNSEHTFWELSCLDYTLGSILQQKSYAPEVCEKAGASYWIAASRNASRIIYGKNKEVVVQDPEIVASKDGSEYHLWMVNGLYSGHCATERDNTWIHAVDVEIARRQLEKRGGQAAVYWSALSGDYEDVAFADEAIAGLYASTLAGVGHKINPVKQLAGREFHEFLQLTHATDGRIEKPLNSLLATLATGNWYVQSLVWLQTVISEVTSNYWELYLRGMPLQICRRLAAYTLDQLMRVKSNVVFDKTVNKMIVDRKKQLYKKLEWLEFAAGEGMSPLFRNVGGTLQPPKYEAVDAVQSTIGAACKVWQQKQEKAWAALHWPQETRNARLEIEKEADWCVAVKDEINFTM